MVRKCVVGILCLLVVVSTACSGTPTVAPSDTPDLTAQANETSAAATQRESEARATDEQATKEAEQATKEAEQSAATGQAATQVRLTQEAAAQEATLAAAVVQTITAATAQAQPMYDLIQQLYGDGYLSRTNGTYFNLPDFDKSWAQIGWYQWYYTDHSPKSFVIRADASWDSASSTANWWTSGCGFVFREDGVENYYLAYLGLDGRVYFRRTVNGRQASLGNVYYGRVGTPDGQAQIMLVVEDANITFFVNGDKVHARQDQGLTSGNLALTLLSGINTDFGTRCKMVNIGLWELK